MAVSGDKTSSTSAGGPAADHDMLLRRELWMERLRRRVYESVARQELLTHTLACVTEMIERQTPRLLACLVFTTDSGDHNGYLHQAVAGRGGDGMTASCIQSTITLDQEWPAAVERWERLPTPPDWAIAATMACESQPGALWTLPLSGSNADDPIVGSLVLFLPDDNLPCDGERAVAGVAAELAGFAISCARLANRAVRQLMHDALTGLPNALLLKDRLTQSIEGARRQSATTALLLIDLDGVRAVNESLGRGAGDDLICKLAARLRDGLRRSDTIARVGGNKFAVVASVKDAACDVASIANKVISLVSSPLKVCGREVALALNVGVSLFPADCQSPDELLQAAEIALHRSRVVGRNSIQFFKPDTESGGLVAMEMETRFRRTVEFSLMSQALGGPTPNDPTGGKLELHYQPQVDHTGRIVGAEALARWTDPTLGRVPPDQFIAAAERNGLIVPFGRWALHEAAVQARRWFDRFGKQAPRVAVNVSAVQFATDRFLDDVAAVLDTYHLTPGMLELELTETVLMHDADEAADRIGRLRKMGLAVAIDDFGTGYSSLAYLHRLTIDTLKVDRSFVAGMAGERRGPVSAAEGPLQGSGAAVTRAIISMGRSLGMNVLAEGVETEAQRHLLLRMGCDQLQGYLFSPPVPAERFEELLVAGRLPLPLAATAQSA